MLKGLILGLVSTSEKKKNKNILQLKTKISSAADKVVYYVMN